MNVETKSLTTAAKLVLELKEKHGISPSDIHSSHVDSVYQNMLKIPSRADFTLVEGLLEFNSDSHSPRCESVCGVIVETRDHFALELVVLNIIQVCNIPVQIFHGTKNLEYIMSTKIGQLVDEGMVYLSKLNAESLSAQAYNALLMSEQFWNKVQGRNKILLFQTDSLLCARSDYSLDDFIDFDYIGGCWHRHRPTGPIIDGGNGGFSLRDWTKSIECLSRFSPVNWGGGEDGYFALHLELMGAKVASFDESAKFATQDFFVYKSFGAHQISNLNFAEQQAFFGYCSLSERVFPSLYQQHQ